MRALIYRYPTSQSLRASGMRDRRFLVPFQFHAFQEELIIGLRDNRNHNKFENTLRSLILQGCEYNEICGSFNSL